MGTIMKPTFDVDQMITSSEASKRFGELRKKAKHRPQYITDNGSVDSVLMGYEIFEQLYDRLTQLEQQEEERILVERIESLDRDPASAKSWKDIRRTT
ncbi:MULTISPECIES: type II toxin-antitoxin system Phd/YefM family antitoxin [unclassified Paenibacillus]|uniref:type II toxin-antitoxin system Phd/YefM family antitoxin n=1 Tax=unclassified Paenibacillus TaxID=185978 RepID=UPI0017878206|nr:type II toxin-antitoxin system Phd/YefM family antitoxin [Paenibacillus sp. 23TSA30-6]MBE0336118.1 type II toxin-antitoxin system Phd/YefM family antitoxin [Paenibacillus sp. 23TSA30-6]